MTHPSHSELKPPDADKLTRGDRMAYVAVGIAAVAIFISAFLGLTVHSLHNDVDAQKAQKYAAIGAATSANASLSAAGLPTVQVPTSAAAPTATVTVTGAQGEQGASGPGPSEAQVVAAVTSYCNTHTCGIPPSAADVAAAVVAYCQAHSSCSGATGPQGAAGQNATVEQIAQAVQNYCAATGGCQGPSGATGPEGPGGPAGPEIPSFTFTVPGVLGDTTYVCSPPASGTQYQCVAQ